MIFLVDQFGGKANACIASPLPGIMFCQSAFEISGNSGVKGLVPALKNIDMPHHGWSQARNTGAPFAPEDYLRVLRKRPPER